jgi:hypothetical protein
MAKRVRTLRSLLIDSFLTAGSVGLLLAVLVAFDGQVRDEVSAMVNGRAASGVTATTDRARKFVSVVASSVKQQSDEHRPLMIMLMAGTALALVMFRM